MKNSETDELPRLTIERDPLFLVLFSASGIILALLTYLLFELFHPMVFVTMVLASFNCFQALWFLLRPFGLCFNNRVEIKQSLLNNKLLYFVDIKSVRLGKKSNLYITYTDDEVEKLNLFGIKKADLNLLKTEIEKQVSAQTLSA